MMAAFAILIWRRKLYELTGEIGFAEKWIGNTVTFYALLGIFVFIISVMWMFGTIQGIVAEKSTGFI